MLGALATLALAIPSLGHGFVRDDIPLVLENALLRAPGGLWKLLSGDFLASLGFTSGLWRPLPLLTLWLDGRLGGWQPGVFHATNVLLAAGASLMVGLILVQAGLARLPAALAALWFASLPAHVEPTAWISGRTDLLAGLCALACLWLDRRARAAGHSGPGWAAPAALAGALLSKESAALWPGVILVAEWVRARSVSTSGRAIARWMAPYLAVTLAWLAAHAAAAGPAALPGYLDAALRARRHAAGWLILPQYLAFLWPWYPHASDVPLPLPEGSLAPLALAGAAFTLAAAGLAVVLAARRAKLAVPCAMVLAPIVPGIAVALARGFLTSGERMVFLPSAGLAWLMAAGIERARAGGPIARAGVQAGAAALVLAGAVETVRLLPGWADDARVFRTMTERQPGNPAGWVGLGQVLAREGRMAEAERALERAVALDPGLPSAAVARAELAYRSGEWERAVAEATRALDLDPTLAPTRLLRASTLVRLGRAAEAGPDLERLLRERPGDPSALAVEGQRLLALGRPGEAVAPLAAAARSAPDDPALWTALGLAQAAGDPAGARASLERALALDPARPAVWRRLASVCAVLGDSAAARAANERAAGAAAGAGGSR